MDRQKRERAGSVEPFYQHRVPGRIGVHQSHGAASVPEAQRRDQFADVVSRRCHPQRQGLVTATHRDDDGVAAVHGRAVDLQGPERALIGDQAGECVEPCPA
ncbi:hypothetical protein [Planctomonas sp. JC2975]|uniref:hypothetical protein n=1 Tax=Planctomonas sp. JC2975 TaxID=2729626 RepID=UPI00197B9CF2|nr:hypothetical protein [Planctomonas sp. JC2975]